MRSFLAALRTLVLPYGATTGPRIILDGIRGVIKLIGGTGNSMELDPTTTTPAIRFFSPDGTKVAYMNSPPGTGTPGPEIGINTAPWTSAALGKDVYSRVYLRTNDFGSVLEMVDAATQAQNGGGLRIDYNSALLSVRTAAGAFVGHVFVLDGTGVLLQYKTGPILKMEPAAITFINGSDATKFISWNHTTGYFESSAALGGTWTAPTFFNSWANPAPADDLFNPAARIDSEGRCWFRGTMVGGTTTDDTKIANFPAPFRPSKSVIMNVGAAGSATRVLLNSAGDMYCYGVSAGSSIGLDGASFAKN